MAGRLSRRFTIVNDKGLHARAAAKLAQVATGFKAKIEVTKSGVTVNARSIMGLMMLAAAKGGDIEVSAAGEDAAEALDAIAGLIESGFGEG